jgi:hypothetical protein
MVVELVSKIKAWIVIHRFVVASGLTINCLYCSWKQLRVCVTKPSCCLSSVKSISLAFYYYKK